MIDPSDLQLTFLFLFSHAHRYENSYELINENTGEPITQRGDVDDIFDDRSTYSTNLCLPQQACYALTVLDSYGDGLTTGGPDAGYSLSVDGVEIASADSNYFFDSNTYKFGICGNEPAPTPPPTANPTPAPTPAITAAPVAGGGGDIPCSVGQLDFDFVITTDDYG